MRSGTTASIATASIVFRAQWGEIVSFGFGLIHQLQVTPTRTCLSPHGSARCRQINRTGF